MKDLLERAVVALERIAVQLENATNPPMMVPGASIRRLRPGECVICGGNHGGLPCPSLMPTAISAVRGAE